MRNRSIFVILLLIVNSCGPKHDSKIDKINDLELTVELKSTPREIVNISASDSPNCDVPKEIITDINKNDKNQNLLLPIDLIDNWTDFISEKICPTVVQGDFNGDTQNDFCILTRDQNVNIYVYEKNEIGYHLVYSEMIAYGIYDKGVGLGIELLKPTVLYSDSISIEMKYEGVDFRKFESSSFTICKIGNEYQKIWGGD